MKGNRISLGLAGSLWFNRAEQKFLGGDRINLLDKIDEYGSITKAAKAVGISYKTAWDIVNMINNLADKPLVDRMAGGKGGGGTSLTAEGKKVITQFKTLQEEHRKFLDNLADRLGDTDSLYQFLRRISMKVSARNTFAGTVTAITKGAVNAEVTISLKGGIPLTAVVTNGAIDNLGLKSGMEAYAIIKAISVIIGTDMHDGNTVSAVITHGSSVRLELKVGGHACALFKASSVIIGVS